MGKVPFALQVSVLYTRQDPFAGIAFVLLFTFQKAQDSSVPLLILASSALLGQALQAVSSYTGARQTYLMVKQLRGGVAQH
ncbi:hypothetical protein [Aeromonas hydrophila]|uniref:hypothetical protein n=1 Tax=Aeromonas hydrophila TaxID=644 RepID=UPI003D259760